MTEDKIKDEPMGLKAKLNQLRIDATGLDWSPAGVLSFGGSKSTLYISLSQMKANLGPLFARNRLEFIPRMAEPKPLGSPSAPSGWLVKLDVTIEDVDSDDSISYTTYGYGSGDKGLVIATSFALKAMLSTTFLVADGVEPIDDETTGPEQLSYTPKTPSEKVATVSKIKEVAAKTPVKPAEPQKPAKSPAKPVEKPVSEPEKPAEAPATSPGVSGISEARRAAVVKLLGDISKSHEDGTVSDSEWDEVSAAAEKICDNTTANMFVIKYRKMVR